MRWQLFGRDLACGTDQNYRLETTDDPRYPQSWEPFEAEIQTSDGRQRFALEPAQIPPRFFVRIEAQAQKVRTGRPGRVAFSLLESSEPQRGIGVNFAQKKKGLQISAFLHEGATAIRRAGDGRGPRPP